MRDLGFWLPTPSVGETAGMASHRPSGYEQARLDAADAGTEPWRAWGPYVAERAWGSVREDYSAGGDAWASFPFEHAVSRTYRWNEDGLCAWSDESQQLCIGLSLWNGQDPVLKERVFGLANAQGNHGEDAKEYWWYLDNTPRTRGCGPGTSIRRRASPTSSWSR